MFDSPNGKISFLSKNKALANYFSYPVYTLTRMDTMEPLLTTVPRNKMFLCYYEVLLVFNNDSPERIGRQVGANLQQSSNQYMFDIVQSKGML